MPSRHMEQQHITVKRLKKGIIFPFTRRRPASLGQMAIWSLCHGSWSLCNDNGYDAIIYGRYPSATTSIWFGTLGGSPCYIHKSCSYNRGSLLYNSSPCYIIGAPCYIIGAPCYIRGAAAHCMMVRDAIFPSPSTWDKSAFFPPLNNEHESISLDR